MIQGQLLPSVLLALAPRVDPSPDRGDMLTDCAGEPLDKGGVDLPTQWREHLLDSGQGAAHHALRHAHQTLAPHSFDHLRGGGAAGACGRGALAWTRASQCGLVVRPAKGLGSRLRVCRGGVGRESGDGTIGRSLSHT